MDHTSKAAELIRRLLESDGKDIDHDKNICAQRSQRICSGKYDAGI